MHAIVETALTIISAFSTLKLSKKDYKNKDPKTNHKITKKTALKRFKMKKHRPKMFRMKKYCSIMVKLISVNTFKCSRTTFIKSKMKGSF
jgi:hypothetical protein